MARRKAKASRRWALSWALAAASSLAGCLLAEGGYRAALCLSARGSSDSGAFELYTAGESTARGTPWPASVSDLAYDMLGGELAGRKIRRIMLARSGDSIYPQALALRAALYCRDASIPAAVLIYSGHNERILPDEEAGSELDAEERLAAVYSRLRDMATRRSYLAAAVVPALERRWRVFGLRDLGHYERYLAFAAEAAQDAGAVPVVAVPAANLSDFEPALTLDEETPLADVEAALAGQAPPGASGPLGAYAAFRDGLRLRREGKAAKARERFQAALDADPRPLRAQSAIVGAVRRLAAERGWAVVDFEALLAARSPAGAGADFFMDNVHPNRRGYQILARAFAAELAGRFSGRSAPAGFHTADTGAGPWLESGLTLLGQTVGHYGAERRLALASDMLESALKKSPGDECALRALEISGRAREKGALIGEDASWLEANVERCLSAR